jgi:pectinesterase
MKKAFLLILSILPALFANAQVYDYVVAKDGTGDYSTIQAAIDAAPTGTTRTTIFVKKGVYNEKVFLGSVTVVLNKVISLIGENRDSVLLTWADYNGMVKPYYTGTSNITYGGPQSATLTVNAADFYMENVTVQNTYLSKQAIAVYNAIDRETFKNCRFVGFQDTHYPKKGRRCFYYKTQIEGGTDFICGGGINYFYQCKIKSLSGGSYITAPEDMTYKATLSTGKTLYYGFIFKDCDLINDGLVPNASVYLGRPWQNTSGSIFLNCRLGNHIKPAGWYRWNADTLTVSLAEFKSMNATGTALADVAGREKWSMQLLEADVNNYLKLTTCYASMGSSTVFDPIPQVISPLPPALISRNGQTLQWSELPTLKGYVVYADGSAIGFTKTGTFTDTASRTVTPEYHVCTVGALGNLSLTDGSTDPVTLTSIDEVVNGNVSIGWSENRIPANVGAILSNGRLEFGQPTDLTLFNLTGRAVLSQKRALQTDVSYLPKGVYLLKAYDNLHGMYFTKIAY